MTHSRTQIRRLSCGRLFVSEAAYGQSFLVASMSSPGDVSQGATEVYANLAEVLRRDEKAIVHERIFGSLAVEQAVKASRRVALEAQGVSADTPVTYIQGCPPWGVGLAGVILRAAPCGGPGEGPWTILENVRPRGRGWRCGDVTFLVLQNIQGPEACLDVHSLPDQARPMIERAERLLSEQGVTYRNVVRTWFYLSHILDWYGRFNEVRNAKYRDLGLMPVREGESLSLPASTGIQGETVGRTAGALDLLAIVGGAKTIVKQLRNVGQKDAFRYGSAFSRGALVTGDDASMIEVSGTASIDEEGESLCRGDFRSQVDCTLDKVTSLLEAQGASPQDICQATVFFKRAEDAPLFHEMAQAHSLDELPAVHVVADICREELLFEMDATAVCR